MISHLTVEEENKMPITTRTTKFDPSQMFQTIADVDHGFPSQTYTAGEIYDKIGHDPKFYTDEKMQHVADVFACNLDDTTSKFDFNDCVDEMLDDLAEYILTT
jgi:hypothetical protein